jgi:hypothetical protein
MLFTKQNIKTLRNKIHQSSKNISTIKIIIYWWKKLNAHKEIFMGWRINIFKMFTLSKEMYIFKVISIKIEVAGSK